jgi:hypothetical protein
VGQLRSRTPSMGGVGMISEVGVELLEEAVTVEVIVEVAQVPVPDFEEVAVPLESDRAAI